MGSLHGATRFHLDNEIGGMGPSRRADLVLLNDDLEPQCTWYGGELVVKNRRVTPLLEETLGEPYRYPKSAYNTVKLPRVPKLVPELPVESVTANTICTELPKIILFHEKIQLAPAESWAEHFAQHDLCFVTVVERHGKSGELAYGLLKNFGLKEGAVASSVGHDAHNIILAGTNEADMALALKTIKASRGRGLCGPPRQGSRRG